MYQVHLEHRDGRKVVTHLFHDYDEAVEAACEAAQAVFGVEGGPLRLSEGLYDAEVSGSVVRIDDNANFTRFDAFNVTHIGAKTERQMNNRERDEYQRELLAGVAAMRKVAVSRGALALRPSYLPVL